jgi:hypothetical protein
MKASTTIFSTKDKAIRKSLQVVLRRELEKYRSESGHPAEIFEELGVQHGVARIDLAVVNGVMHGYEIKSDLDTLQRLPEQMKEYNTVFDKLTLVVGRSHVCEAINIIPDWWGVMVARTNENNEVFFHIIREAEDNKEQVSLSIARLLWRAEALKILEEKNKAAGVRSKPRELIYERLASVLDIDNLKDYVRNTLLVSRKDWRVGVSLVTSGD